MAHARCFSFLEFTCSLLSHTPFHCDSRASFHGSSAPTGRHSNAIVLLSVVAHQAGPSLYELSSIFPAATCSGIVSPSASRSQTGFLTGAAGEGGEFLSHRHQISARHNLWDSVDPESTAE